MGALTASEDRLGEQLGKIGRQLDEVLQQPYSTAIAAGSSLQEAVAERYVVLSSIALGRWDAVPAALELKNKTAFEALISALPLVGSRAYGRAAAQLARQRRAGRLWWREERIEVLTREIVGAAMEVVQLALGLIEEIRTLADELGHDPQPEVKLHVPQGYGQRRSAADDGASGDLTNPIRASAVRPTAGGLDLARRPASRDATASAAAVAGPRQRRTQRRRQR